MEIIIVPDNASFTNLFLVVFAHYPIGRIDTGCLLRHYTLNCSSKPSDWLERLAIFHCKELSLPNQCDPSISDDLSLPWLGVMYAADRCSCISRRTAPRSLCTSHRSHYRPVYQTPPRAQPRPDRNPQVESFSLVIHSEQQSFQYLHDGAATFHGLDSGTPQEEYTRSCSGTNKALCCWWTLLGFESTTRNLRPDSHTRTLQLTRLPWCDSANRILPNAVEIFNCCSSHEPLMFCFSVTTSFNQKTQPWPLRLGITYNKWILPASGT